MTAVLCVLALSACAEDEAPFLEEDAGDPPHPLTACPEDVPETSIDMTVEGPGGALRATLVEADNLPAVKGFNTWVVELTDADDEPGVAAAAAARPRLSPRNHLQLRTRRADLHRVARRRCCVSLAS